MYYLLSSTLCHVTYYRPRRVVLQEARVRLEARLEAAQDKLSGAQHEALRLQQQLDDATRGRGGAGSEAVENATFLNQLKLDQQAVRDFSESVREGCRGNQMCTTCTQCSESHTHTKKHTRTRTHTHAHTNPLTQVLYVHTHTQTFRVAVVTCSWRLSHAAVECSCTTFGFFPRSCTNRSESLVSCQIASCFSNFLCRRDPHWRNGMPV